MRKLGWTLLALGLIVAIVVLTAPARLLTDHLAKQNPQLGFSGVSGPWWAGEVADLRSGGQALGQLSWRVRQATLLQAEPAVDLQLQGKGIDLTGLARWMDGDLILEQVNGRIDARWLQPAVGIPLLSFTGAVDVDLREFRRGPDGVPQSLDLRLIWTDAGVSGLAAARLGTITFTASGADGRFDGRVSSAPGDPLAVDGKFRLAERRYRTEVRLHPRDPADPVAQALRWVGQPDGRGGRLLIVEGELLLPPAEVPPP